MRTKPGRGICGRHGSGHPESWPLCATRRYAAVLLTCFLLGGPISAPQAFAHEGDPSSEGYLFVQQALAHLVHEPGDLDPVLEKVDAALAAADQDGVSVPDLQQAKDALQAGNSARGRTLLQESITVALSTLRPATGDETGTAVVLDPLPPRGGLTGADVGLLSVSMLVLLTGLVLAYAFRPPENVRELRLLLSSKHRRQDLPPKRERSGRKEP